jgi:hypothetical protein
MRTVTSSRVVVGWLGTNIRAVLQRDVNLISHFAFVLITSIDSAIDLPTAAVAKRIVEKHPRCGFLGKGLLVPGVDIAEIVEAFDLFNGFDELWCFDSSPTAPKPEDVLIMPPLNVNNDEEAIRRVASWMMESRCTLGLGDGIGLNFVTIDETIAHILEQLANSGW